MRGLFTLISLTLAFGAAADEPVSAAMKLYEKRRYEQAARLLESAKDSGPQGQLVLGMIYLRNADLHEAFARAAAPARRRTTSRASAPTRVSRAATARSPASPSAPRRRATHSR